MKKIALQLFIITLTLVVLGYFASENRSLFVSKGVTKEEDKPVTTITPKPASQVYENKLGGYMVKYPNLLIIEPNSNLRQSDVRFRFASAAKDSDIVGYIEIYSRPAYPGVVLEQIIGEDCSIGCYSKDEIVFDELEVAGERALGNPAQAQYAAYDVSLLLNGKLIVVRLEGNTTGRDKEIFNGLIATLKEAK